MYSLCNPLGTVSPRTERRWPSLSRTRSERGNGNPKYRVSYSQRYGRALRHTVRAVGGSASSLDGQSLVESTPYCHVDGMWTRLSQMYGDEVALIDPHAPSTRKEFSFNEVEDLVSRCRAGLSKLGLEEGDRVSLFAENSHRWLIVDQGIMRCGAVSAVRGVSSSKEELQYIMKSSKSVGLIVQDVETLKKMELSEEDVNRLKFIILLWGDSTSDGLSESFGAKTFDEVVAECSGVDLPVGSGDTDLATIVYTSGTTGEPKGVKLTHSNIQYQIDHFSEFVDIVPGENVLSILPAWHMYQRTSMYYVSSRGGCLIFTNIRSMKKDLQKYTLDHFVCVPLILDTLYSRILATMTKNVSALRRVIATFLLHAAVAWVQWRRVLQGTDIEFAMRQPSVLQYMRAAIGVAVLSLPFIMFRALVATKIRTALGIRKSIISGGGSLSPYLDDFYEAVGLSIINGYGLSETSPVLTCRSETRDDGNIRGTVGRPIRGTDIRIVDGDTFEDVEDGQKGIILAKGPGVFTGYDSNERATSDAFYGNYFITGDVGWRIPSSSAKMGGSIVVQGRAKDTIVLTNGENVEPSPIEDDICRSPRIKFAILIGNGKRSLGALIVPDVDHIAADMQKEHPSKEDITEAVWEAVRSAHVPGRQIWERVNAIEVLDREFSVEDGTLTRTMKPRRPIIFEKYADSIERLEQQLR